MAVPARKNENRRTGRISSNRYKLRGTGNRGDTVPMFRKKDVPPGKYRIKVSKVEYVKTRAGADALAVTYDLTAADGKTMKAREILPLDLWVFDEWSDAMIAAGLKPGSDVEDAVGVEEDVEVVYTTDSGLGQLRNRTPVTKGRSVVASEGEESCEEDDVDGFDVDDYDYLDEDDDD